MSILTKIFGDPNVRFLRSLQPVVERINALEPTYRAMSDADLAGLKARWQADHAAGKNLDDLLPEVFAAVREAARRTLGQRHYDVQLLGGMVLHRGQIAEMRTGEGKTLVATLPVTLNAIAGKGVHLVTVNDYLVRRDTVWMGQVYHALGFSVGCIQHERAFYYDPSIAGNEGETDDASRGTTGVFKVEYRHLRPVPRREAYAADVTYGTNNEYGFDYLRDNMVSRLDDMVQSRLPSNRVPIAQQSRILDRVGRSSSRLSKSRTSETLAESGRDSYLSYAIVDEIDSILIDEARTPLIISAPDSESSERYAQFAKIVRTLVENTDYNVDEKMKASTLTEEGITKVERALGVANLYAEGGITSVHHIETALKAHALYRRDRDYVAKDGEIIIVDEFTGRLMHGRRYSEGLHQAIEAKEGVKVQQESKTLATVTFQNYFRLYKKLAGMTGTAATEAEEFSKIYKLEVTQIPTNQPMVRADLPDRIYKNERGKFQAVVAEIKARHEHGQPVLVGTISIEKNELLAELLSQQGIQAAVLNAKQHEQEAEIIAQAGRAGTVTVATNMAGRGVDIILGGNPPDESEAAKVRAAGGLHVIGTERHESRRIDNQLRGRSGRQGDDGSTQFYLSTEDDLMRVFGSSRIRGLMEAFKIPEDVPIEAKMVTRSLAAAQRKVEGHNFDLRKHLVEYDDVANKHREVIYRKRRETLTKASLRDDILKLVEAELSAVVTFHTAGDDEKSWNLQEIYEVVHTIFPLPAQERKTFEDFRRTAGDKLADATARTKLIEHLMACARSAYDALEQQAAVALGQPDAMRVIERAVVLRATDTLWMEHLDAMDHLRTGIGLRGYGQRDPLVEYQKEAYRMFTELINLIGKQVVYGIYKVGGVREITPVVDERRLQLSAPLKEMQRGAPIMAGDEDMQKEVARRSAPVEVENERTHYQGVKVGRNNPCPCGSGKKFKKCHGA